VAEESARRGRAVDAAAALVVLAIAGAFLVAARREPPPLYDPLGPGTLPALVAALLAMLALVLLARALLGLAVGQSTQSLVLGLDGVAADDYRLRPGLAAFCLVALAAYAAAIELRLPFAWSSFAFLAALGGAMAWPRRRLALVALAVAAIGAVAIDLLFRRFLHVPLP
jgi:putative tricarboxylic transport membrane protein